MKTIETIVTITPDGTLRVHLDNVAPGEYRAVLVLEEESVHETKRPPLNFPIDDLGPWPEDWSLKREDWYDDEGR
jgi:hypothetical protein